MFLPLLTASSVRNGASLIGRTVPAARSTRRYYHVPDRRGQAPPVEHPQGAFRVSPRRCSGSRPRRARPDVHEARGGREGRPAGRTSRRTGHPTRRRDPAAAERDRAASRRQADRAIGASSAPVRRTRSAGASSTCRPRRPAADVDGASAVADASSDRREPPAPAERADPADDVAGGPLGRGRLGQRRPAAAERPRERLEVELAGDRHDRGDERARRRRRPAS